MHPFPITLCESSPVANGTVGLLHLSADPQTWREPMGVLALAAAALMLVAGCWAYLAVRHTRHALVV